MATQQIMSVDAPLPARRTVILAQRLAAATVAASATWPSPSTCRQYIYVFGRAATFLLCCGSHVARRIPRFIDKNLCVGFCILVAIHYRGRETGS